MYRHGRAPLALAGAIYLVLTSISSAAITANGNIEPAENATWTSDTVAFVGKAGDGTVRVDGGSAVLCMTSILGNNSDCTGRVVVDGAGSRWTNSDNLIVGEKGVGELTITGGGAVSDRFGCLGLSRGSTGTVTVDGDETTWSNGDFRVGGLGNGFLHVANGATVTCSYAALGYNAGAKGTATVDGAGSSWSQPLYLHVGLWGEGMLTITNGAAVGSTIGSIGYFSDSTGIATVDGKGSIWRSTGWFLVGSDGGGILNITDGGLVVVEKTLSIDSNMDGDGFVNMATGGMLALHGRADDSIASFLSMVQGTAAIRYWDDDLSDWSPISIARNGTDYSLTYSSDGGGLDGYTVLTVPEPSAASLFLLVWALATMKRRSREKQGTAHSHPKCEGRDRKTVWCPQIHSMSYGAAVAVLLGTAGLAWCQGWQTYQGNAFHNGYVPCQIEPLRLSLDWTWNTSSSGRIATDGRTVVKGNGTTLTALDAFSGSPLWSLSGAFSEPAISDGIIYVTTSTQGMSGLFNWFNAYNLADGSLVFRTHLDTQWDTYLAPTAGPDGVYIGSGKYGGIFGFDKATGSQLFGYHSGFGSGADNWTPSVNDTVVLAYVNPRASYAGTKNNFYGLDPVTGVARYVVIDANSRANEFSMQQSPAFGSSQDAFIIDNKRLVKFDLSAGGIEWERSGDFIGQPSVANQVVYSIAGSGGKYSLVASNEHSGEQLWRYDAGTALRSAIIITDDVAFIEDASTVYAIELDSHSLVWSYVAGKTSTMALDGERLYVWGGADGKSLIAITVPEPATLSLLAGTGLVICRRRSRFQPLVQHASTQLPRQ